MKEPRWGNEYRLTTVCIDSYENSELKGRFYNPHLSEGKAFGSLMQFLREMESLLDDMSFPQSYTVTRTFSSSPEPKKTCLPASHLNHGRLATFAVRIIFRQNASWQGSVIWQGQRKEQSFRSVLELIFLMDSALGEVLKPSVPSLLRDCQCTD